MNRVKQVSFPKQLLKYADERVKELGIGFPEYIRYLVIEDTKKYRKYETPELTLEEEAALLRALEDVKKGRTTLLETEEDIDAHFEKLKREAAAQ